MSRWDSFTLYPLFVRRLQISPAIITDSSGFFYVAFSDGTYEVGTGDGQILPGKYTVGAAAGPMGNYYEISQGGQVIKNDYTHGPTFMTVAKGQTVKVSGGGLWTANSGW